MFKRPLLAFAFSFSAFSMLAVQNLWVFFPHYIGDTWQYTIHNTNFTYQTDSIVADCCAPKMSNSRHFNLSNIRQTLENFLIIAIFV
jgi:hypothetical protein